MRILYSIIATTCIAWSAMAQAPAWSVDASQYNYNMVMVGLVKVDGMETSSAGDRVAAFINGEVRGVATPVFQEQLNRNIFYLIIYHNDDGGTITFKYYDANANTVTTAAQTAVFAVDGLTGNANRPFVWSNRTTRSEAVLLTYKLPGQLGSRVYNDSVAVRVSIGTDVSSVTADFTVSEGAGVYINNQRQTSGVTSGDLSVPVMLVVRSEDEQIIREYALHIREGKDEIPNVLFPNGTAQNKTWGIAHLGLVEPVVIRVFDLNGQVVFTATDAQQEWSGRFQGKQVPEGTYFYSIDREGGSKYQGSLQVIY